MNKMNGLNLSQDYLKLDKSMYSLIEPNQLNKGETVILNENLLKDIGLNKELFDDKLLTQLLSGNTNENGTLYSQAYSGHQYGYFTNLGDGRAVMIGEQNYNGKKVDLQLKGFGQTPYSRSGDGKATLYSMLREYLISEAMHALEVPTTRALSVIKTNESVRREQMEQGGILCRVASSHIRVGTFQYAYSTGGNERVKELADYAINLHYPSLTNSENKYQQFLGKVIEGQAKLIAKWQSIGFVHGVMNTDNMLISGDTIDYGPCAFLDQYIPDKSFSSIDANGRYAYLQQPYIGSWNLARFAETLLGILSTEQKEAVEIANTELSKYEKLFKNHYYSLMASKIGIIDPIDDEKELIDDLLNIMEKYKADFTNTFRLLTQDRFEELPFYNSTEWQDWFRKWTRQLGTRQMNVQARISLMEKSNPVLIPRNLLVEEALKQASYNNDYTLFNNLLDKLYSPYNYKIQHDKKYFEPINSKDEYVTYCGT